MKILYPPHPGTNFRTKPNGLQKYEDSRKWVAQRKFNGTHIALNVAGDTVNLLTRHGTPTKKFSLSESHKAQILSLNLDSFDEHWFAGELLGAGRVASEASPMYQGKIVLFDLLHAGRYLLGFDQMKRLSILNEICRHPQTLEPHNGIALRITEDIWLAEHFENDFENQYKKFLHLDEIEGLILRRKTSSLDKTGSKKYDVTWMVRCRKPDKAGNYDW